MLTINPVDEGSIPACAGEPIGQRVALPAAAVYPRVCGGTNAELAFRQYAVGLSPRVRGNPSVARASSLWARSIPACAGEPAS